MPILILALVLILKTSRLVSRTLKLLQRQSKGRKPVDKNFLRQDTSDASLQASNNQSSRKRSRSEKLTGSLEVDSEFRLNTESIKITDQYQTTTFNVTESVVEGSLETSEPPKTHLEEKTKFQRRELNFRESVKEVGLLIPQFVLFEACMVLPFQITAQNNFRSQKFGYSKMLIYNIFCPILVPYSLFLIETGVKIAGLLIVVPALYLGVGYMVVPDQRTTAFEMMSFAILNGFRVLWRPLSLGYLARQKPESLNIVGLLFLLTTHSVAEYCSLLLAWSFSDDFLALWILISSLVIFGFTQFHDDRKRL